MTATFDIFELEPGGSVMWRGSTAAFEEARAFVEQLGTSRRGDYIIFSLQTGKKVVIKPDGSTAEQEVGQI